MSDSEYYAKITTLPKYGERVNEYNVEEGDIITLKVKNRPIFCKVIGFTPTMIKVVDLKCHIYDDSIQFKISNKVNDTTKGMLSKTREMYKIIDVIYY